MASIERVGGRKCLAVGFLVATMVSVWLLNAAESASSRPLLGHSFTVNSTGDQPDADLANGACDADTAVAGSQCTLRAAVGEANATPNATFEGSPVKDLIRFNIAGSGVHTIKPNSTLRVTEAVTIDGYSQPGSSPNTLAKGTNAVLLIELDGTNSLASPVGLSINTSNSVIRGLAINRFPSNGVVISGDGNRLEGNFIGTDPGGAQDLGNSSDGVFVNNGSGNTVGGATRDKRNLISGNGGGGIGILDPGNGVSGNLIGTDNSGSGDLGNSFNGVRLADANNTVGGPTAGEANTIAFNGNDSGASDGVSVNGSSGAGNSILRNSIFSNQDLGVDLGENGPTANDPLDSDTGPNGLQNKPDITSAITSATATTIKGRLNSTPGTTFDIQLFANPGGTNEGKKFIAQKSVTTAADGTVTFAFKPASRIAVGQAITAAATDPGGSTSEFSAPREAMAQ